MCLREHESCCFPPLSRRAFPRATVTRTNTNVSGVFRRPDLSGQSSVPYKGPSISTGCTGGHVPPSPGTIEATWSHLKDTRLRKHLLSTHRVPSRGHSHRAWKPGASGCQQHTALHTAGASCCQGPEEPGFSGAPQGSQEGTPLSAVRKHGEAGGLSTSGLPRDPGLTRGWSEPGPRV